MFDCFSRHRFQSFKGWLKFWTRLPEWFLNFEELKYANFKRYHIDTYLKNTRIQRFMEEVDRKSLEKRLYCWIYLRMNTHSQKKIDFSLIIFHKICTQTYKSGAEMTQISNSCVSIKFKESLFSVRFKLRRFIYVKGMALIAFRNFLHWFESFDWSGLVWSDQYGNEYYASRIIA